MREIKFRVWDGIKIRTVNRLEFTFSGDLIGAKTYRFMQYTGLKDKNGVEIYEYMEIDNIYEVSFFNGNYILTNISNGDIMLLSDYMENNNGKVEITREYTKV